MDLVRSTVDRRSFLAAAASVCAMPLVGIADESSAPTQARTAMGLASNALDVRLKSQRSTGQKPDISDPLTLLEVCHGLGLAGIQAPLGTRDMEYATRLRNAAEQRNMYVEASVSLAGILQSIEGFERQILTARSAGARVARTVAFPGRRYEVFNAAGEFAKASMNALESLQRAEPIAAKHGIRLALENHKDQRVSERLDLLKRISSEFLGICVDVGNSFTLCEDSTEVVRAYAPWAFSVHIKDQAAREYPDGFLYADVALGKGLLDLPEMVRILRMAHPEVRFNYEVITRDPLKVPVLTDRYWATMPHVPGADLARTLRTVRQKSPPEPFPVISSMPIDKQVEFESRYIRESIAYAREKLQL